MTNRWLLAACALVGALCTWLMIEWRRAEAQLAERRVLLAELTELTPMYPRCAPNVTGTRAPLLVMNHRTEPVDLFWLGPDGAEKHYARIPPGHQSTQDTYDGHLWRVRDVTGALLVELAAASTGQVMVR